MNATVIVKPRRTGEPEVDLTSFRIIHRAMREDVRRLAALGPGPFRPEREQALRRYLQHLVHEIHQHHTREDDVIWPVINASAGAAVDLTPLSEDHHQLALLLDELPESTGVRRAALLASLRDLLDEHITEEEATVFPVIRRYVSIADFTECERRFRGRPTPKELRFVGPWIARHCTRGEYDHLIDQAGLPFRIVIMLTRGWYLRLERIVFAG